MISDMRGIRSGADAALEEMRARVRSNRGRLWLGLVTSSRSESRRIKRDLAASRLLQCTLSLSAPRRRGRVYGT